MIVDEDSIDFKKYFVVDQSSPTGLRWRDDVKRLEEGKVGGNSWGGTQAGYHKQAKGRVKTTVVSLNKKVYVVSRIIWNMLYGKIPDGMIVDHLDGNPWNNTPSNLACKTRAENIRNCARRKDNSSGFVGVSFIVKGASPRHIQSVIEDLIVVCLEGQTLADKVLRLNPKSEEIGAGMLVNLQEIAGKITEIY